MRFELEIESIEMVDVEWSKIHFGTHGLYTRFGYLDVRTDEAARWKIGDRVAVEVEGAET
jgi:hypothetical protein